jgi:uncharacterized protein (TIGR02246 family)
LRADKPEDVHRLFAEYFSAGELDKLLSLYEPDAALLEQTGSVVSGTDALRQTLQGFLAMKGEMRLAVRRTVVAGDLALLISDWEIYRTAPEGREVASSGRTSDVVRRQADGRWLLAIDSPRGTQL